MAALRHETQQFDYTRPWLYPKQKAAIFEPQDSTGLPARYSLIEASTKTGKTVGCIAWLFERAAAGKDGQNFWWVAPVYGQAKIAYRRMKAGLPRSAFISNEQDLTITLFHSGGPTVWFKSAEKPDGLYGEDVFAAVLDEASRMREEAFHAIRSTLTATRGPIRIIGNVKGRRNWFFALCRKAETGEPGMSYHKLIAADAVAAQVLADDEVKDAERVLPAAVFRELYLAEPSDDGGNPFGLKDIAACVVPLAPGPVSAWGWDLAKSTDWTVGIGLNAAGKVCRFERFQKPWLATIQSIKTITGSTPALVDSTGVGDPILEALQQGSAHQNFLGFKFTLQSKQQLMEGLAVAIQRREVGFPDGIIRLELEAYEYEYTRLGVRYSAPEGYHDDTVCAIALAKKQLGERRGLEVWRRLAG